MAKTKKAKQEDGGAAEVAPPPSPFVPKWPFTGEPLGIVEHTGIMCYSARGPFWSTRLYQDKDRLLEALSRRDGGDPSYHVPRITTTELVRPPPDPVADQVAAFKTLRDKLEDGLDVKLG